MFNFGAYTFIPITLVNSLGALNSLFSAILAAYFLKEKLSTVAKIGCGLTVIGSSVMAIHAPKDIKADSMSELLSGFRDPSNF